MFKALLMDDEKLALLQLERLLLKDGRFQVAGAYTNAQMGLQHLQQEKIDVVFLDIDMPEMNGLEAAEHVQQINGNASIVFVTAYSEHAIEAFELNAVDYLLKPVEPGRFVKTLNRLEAASLLLRQASGQDQQPDSLPLTSSTDQEGSYQIKKPNVRSFGRLFIESGTEDDKPRKWRTLKSQELFAYLLQHKNQWVAKSRLLDIVWPDYKAEKAMTHLHTSVYQIRKMLREWNLQAKIEFSHESYRFSSDTIVADVELLVSATETSSLLVKDRYTYYDYVLSLYEGDYLEEHDYPWSRLRREDLRRRFIQLSMLTAKYELSSGMEHKAWNRMIAVREREPYSEEIFRLLMTTYAKIGDNAGLIHLYEQFKSLLAQELKVQPDIRTQALFDELLHRAE